MLVLRIDEVQHNHQLATVADTERKGILTGLELIESLLSLRLDEECTSPTLGRTENVGVRETTAEYDEVHILQSLTNRNQVGHHHILYFEAGEIHRVCHLTLTIGTLLTDDSCLDARWLATVSVEAVASEGSLEAITEVHLDRLLLIVGVTLLSHTVHTLLAVEEVRCLIPVFAQSIDIELVLEAFLLDDNLAELRSWITNLGITDTVLIEECFHLVLVSIAFLVDNTWVLCEESLDDVGI